MFMIFIVMVDRQFSLTIRLVQSDNATEFSYTLDYFVATCILFQTSCVSTPQQDIINVSCALHFQAQTSIFFLGECVLPAAHLIYHTPTSTLQNKTPFKILFNKSPSFSSLRTYGCLCFAHNQKN